MSALRSWAKVEFDVVGKGFEVCRNPSVVFTEFSPKSTYFFANFTYFL